MAMGGGVANGNGDACTRMQRSLPPTSMPMPRSLQREHLGEERQSVLVGHISHAGRLGGDGLPLFQVERTRLGSLLPTLKDEPTRPHQVDQALLRGLVYRTLFDLGVPRICSHGSGEDLAVEGIQLDPPHSMAHLARHGSVLLALPLDKALTVNETRRARALTRGDESRLLLEQAISALAGLGLVRHRVEIDEV